MVQQNYKIIETNYNLNDYEKLVPKLLEFEFFRQNLDAHRLCLKHKTNNEFKVTSEGNQKYTLTRCAL